MCLLVMVSRLEEAAPLVVGANRDERLDRPATAMTVLRSAGPRILGGRDEQAGGTWLAVNEHGLVAALTNRPASEDHDPSRRSRGELPLALARHSSAREAVEDFVCRFRPLDYNPAWLLVGDRHSLYSLDMTGDLPVAEELPAGVHILENLPPRSCSPKVEHVREILGDVGGPGLRGAALVGRLRRVLGDHSLPGNPDELSGPDQGATWGPVRPPETLAACVHTDTYGTRSSTIVRVPANENAQISVVVAHGHPCTSPFVDAEELWARP
ncbi:MAG: NRDE family protein [Acidimicrobiales bacterium]|jgi:uncharacterized protein with NRDE domain